MEKLDFFIDKNTTHSRFNNVVIDDGKRTGMKSFVSAMLKTFFTLIFLSNLSLQFVLAQDCILSGDVKMEVKNPCGGNDNGQVVFIFNQKVEGLIEKNVGLYLKDDGVFFRNRLNTNDLKIEGDKITYENLPSGSYQLAVYLKDCQGFPNPSLFPTEGILLMNDENCSE